MGFMDKLSELGEQAKQVKQKVDQISGKSTTTFDPGGGSGPAPSSPASAAGPPSGPAERWDPPSAAEVAGAAEDVDGRRRNHEWDRFVDPVEATNWVPTGRRHVLGTTGWEGLIFEGPGSVSVQIVTKDVPGIYGDPRSLLRVLQPGAQDHTGTYDGVSLVAVGRDSDGYSTAAVVINELAFIVRSVGGDGSQDDLDLVYRMAFLALDALA